MKNNIIIGLLFVVIIIVGAVILTKDSSVPTNNEVAVLPEYKVLLEQQQAQAEALRTQLAENLRFGTSSASQYTNVSGVSFVVPAGMAQVNPSEFYPFKTYTSRGVTFQSIDYTEREIKEPYSSATTVITGAGISIGFSPADINQNIKRSDLYAKFQMEITANCPSCTMPQIISIDGVPAFFKLITWSGGGGTAAVSMYANGEIFETSLSYGYLESYKTFEPIFNEFLSSIKFD